MATLTREINILIESTSDRSSKKLALEKLLKHSQGTTLQSACNLSLVRSLQPGNDRIYAHFIGFRFKNACGSD